MKPRLKAALINVALLATFTFGAVLLGEAVVRIGFKDNVVLFPRYHTDVQYGDFVLRRIRPNAHFRHTSTDGSWTFTTNAQGFRNVEDFAYEKPSNTFRVLSLGDSHTQGYEVRQQYTFSAVMDRALVARGWNVEVMNAGVSGFSTAEQLAFLENEGVRYAPDAVVLGFYANDYEDNIKAGLFRLDERGTLVVDRTRHTPGVRIQNALYRVPFTRWLGENSYFYSVMFNGVWQAAKRALAKSAEARVVEFAVPTQAEVSSYESRLAAALLERMRAFCQEHGITLIVLDIPKQLDDGIASSLDDTVKAVALQTDGLVDSERALADYAAVAELHVPNGNRHISEFTHVLLGVEAAQLLEALHSDARIPDGVISRATQETVKDD